MNIFIMMLVRRRRITLGELKVTYKDNIRKLKRYVRGLRGLRGFKLYQLYPTKPWGPLRPNRPNPNLRGVIKKFINYFNNQCNLFSLCFQTRSVLFLGDITDADILRRCLSYTDRTRFHFLFAPHHGTQLGEQLRRYNIWSNYILCSVTQRRTFRDIFRYFRKYFN